MFIALAVAFSGKLDSHGTIIAILIAGAVGIIGLYTHIHSRTKQVFTIVLYGIALWAFESYLVKPNSVSTTTAGTQKPDVGSTIQQGKVQVSPSMSAHVEVAAPQKKSHPKRKIAKSEPKPPVQQPQDCSQSVKLNNVGVFNGDGVGLHIVDPKGIGGVCLSGVKSSGNKGDNILIEPTDTTNVK